MMKKFSLQDLGINIARGEQKTIDYRTHHFAIGELFLYLSGCIAFIGLVASLFYDSVYAFLLGLPFLIPMMKYLGRQKMISTQKELRRQFKDMILSVSAAQKAGYSVENSFREAIPDMELLFGKKSLIVRELRRIAIGMDHNMSLEELLLDLGDRSNNEDIRQFGEIFMISKRSGGNLTEIMALCAEVLEQKEEVEQEIQVVISSKKMEARIMSVVPFLIILYLSSSSGGFFDSLYHNPAGILIMSACLAVYVVAFLLSEKIVEIQI